MQSPYYLHRAIYGPKAQSKAVFYITCGLGIFVTLMVFGGAWIALP